MKQDPPILFFADDTAWESWLADHYDMQTGVWLKFAKKSSGIPSLTYAEALDVGLCYGWIDGQTRSVDEIYYLQKFTPRRPKSTWSKVNVGKVEALIAAGKMRAPGQAQIDAARADGRWDNAYESQATATIPEDFAAALAKNQKAQAFYDTLTKANKYSFWFRLKNAKTPEKREQLIQKFLTMLESGKSYH